MHKRNRSIIQVALLSLVLFLFLVTASIQLIAPVIIHKKLTSIVDKCDDCNLEIGGISFLPLRGQLILKNIVFTQGDPYFTQISAKIESITLNYSWRDLRSKKMRFTKISIQTPVVVITEGDGISPENEKKEKTTSAKIWQIEIESTEIYNGNFLYQRQYKDQLAPIHVNEIQARISSWKSSLPSQIVHASAAGLLEKTGLFKLDIRSPLFSETSQVQVDLQIEKLNLSDLNPFFETSEAIKLTGILYKGKSHVEIMDNKQEAWVIAKYTDLDINFERSRKRGAITTFLSNLIESLKVDENNTKENITEQVRGVSILRRKTESLVSFILRGMKDSALKITTR